MDIFQEKEIRSTVSLNHEVITVIESAFNQLMTQSVHMPPIMRVDVPENNGEVDVKSAYIPGYDTFAIKVSSGFFDNWKQGLPSASGLMMLISSQTGVPKTILQDNGYLTDVRTAAAGAVAANYLAREASQIAGIIGSGAQARYQTKALALVRNLQEVIVYGRTPEKVQKFKKDMEHELKIPVKIAESAETVVRNSDTVVTTTPAESPIIRSDWLHPGLHITAMGSDAEQKQELDSDVLEQADTVVCDVKSQSLRLGELRSCPSDQVINNVYELGQLTTGKVKARERDDAVTICDLTGTGVQDTAIARYAYDKLKQPTYSK